MDLPHNKSLPIHLLAACFNNTSATYKFYWFLSILQAVELGEETIKKRHLFARMIANAWYTINYFHISFGVQDKIQRAAEELKNIENLKIDDDREIIFQTLVSTNNTETLSLLNYFNNQVPHWFLSPWFEKMTKNQIYELSKNFENRHLYALYDTEIVINPFWHEYLMANSKLLKDFCFWNLVIFLQVRNPNVPDIPNKIIKPASRNNLNKQRKDFWDIVLNEKGIVKCIYTGKDLSIGNYAVEHFVPYNFVSHDLIWNLIPAEKSFNIYKSDRLPTMDKYFIPFFELQKAAIEIVRFKSPSNKFLEDYYSIFSDFDHFANLSEITIREKFRDRIQPLISIAANNGFQYLT